MTAADEKRSWFDRPLSAAVPALTGEVLLFVLILTLTVVSRLYGLGDRAMSHDESLHVYYSWLFSQGQGYQHTPLTHGPLQFHLLAATYFFLGDNDFTARLPHALASILTVALLWRWRRYLGRAGALIAAAAMLISPFMLYYGRYARNEAFVGLFGLLTLYAILRYLESGQKRHLFLLTAATILHFTAKETAFIYTALALLFLAAHLIHRATRRRWGKDSLYNPFLLVLSAGMLLVGAVFGLAAYQRLQAVQDASQTAAPPILGGTTEALAAAGPAASPALILGIAAGVVLLAAAVLLVAGYGWERLRRERSFDLLLLLGSLVLPLLAAFPVMALRWDPLAYAFVWPGWDLATIFAQAPARTAVVWAGLVVLSAVIGLVWDRRTWPAHALLFWGVYAFFHTSVFTNWSGFFTGAVGSLGYWLAQQAVRRGNQPWYYYLLIQIPIYEFLPALGAGLAAWLGLRRPSPVPARDPGPEPAPETIPTFGLLVWWTLGNLLALTFAGEKMPWLTFHIALPMILLTGWGLGRVIEGLDWDGLRERGASLAAALTAGALVGLGGTLLAALGAHPPFQGKNLEQLSATGEFLFWLVAALACAGGLWRLLSGWDRRNVLGLAALALFGLLALQTGRAAYRAAFVHYDDASEYLVYAHAGSGVRNVADQLERLSGRIAGERNLAVAYDRGGDAQGVAWPLTWYLRHYPNKTPFESPGSELRDVPVILVDPQNYETIPAVVRSNYYRLDYIRMVWPAQDYFGLTWPRLRQALSDPAMRTAIFRIWLDRDYSLYAQLTGKTTLEISNWQPADTMRLYIRKDYAARTWDYGIVQEGAVKPDPYEGGKVSINADVVTGDLGAGQGQFDGPRGIAAAPDGSVYVADSRNHRIQHFSADGEFLGAWGSLTNPDDGTAPLGTLNEPWAVAVSPDGQWVYVADTWNHRVQKFTADGRPVAAWGHALYDPLASDPLGMWGPRGIAVDSQGRVLVADTGNKRILAFDADGNFITLLGGGGGLDPGQFEEPVGLAFDAEDNLYVADTWNQRIQVFAPGEDGTTYTPLRQWEVAGWYSDSLENKPYLTVDSRGRVFVTDPDAFRVIEFTLFGGFVRTWGDYGFGAAQFGLASGVAVDPDGRVWVSDPGNNRLMRFSLP